MAECIRVGGANDPPGGGSQSARLTFGLVSAGSQVRALLDDVGWSCAAHLHSIGEVSAKPLFELERTAALDPASDMGSSELQRPGGGG